MREQAPWAVAALLAVLCIAPLSAEESQGPGPIKFVPPATQDPEKGNADTVQAAPAAQPAPAASSSEELTFVSPENIDTSDSPKKPVQSVTPEEAARLTATVKKKVEARGERDRNPNTMFEERQGLESVLGAVEKATEATFSPAGMKEEAINVADDKPGQKKPAVVDEKGSQDIVKGGFSAENPQGAMAYFKGKTLVETSYYQALQRALDKNLSIRFSEKSYDRTKHSIKKAQAAFDPVFSLQINGTQTDTFERREFITRRRFIGGEIQNDITDTIFQASEEQQEEPLDPFANRGAFDRVGANARFRAETITQSFFQQIPWGPFFNLNFSQKHNKVIFQEFTTEDTFQIDDTGSFLTDPTPSGGPGTPIGVFGQVDPTRGQAQQKKRSIFYEASGRIVRDPTQRPWTSSLNVRLIVPVPYTKDWGPYGPAEVPIKFAEVARERAYWDLQSTVNNTMLTVNNAYWDVVRAIRRLELTITTRKGLEQMLKQSEDLLKGGRATAYEVTQVKQQLASVRRGEQGEWARYVAASNALKNVLDHDNDVVILPVAYGPVLSGVPPQTLDDAIATAMAGNPDIQAAKTDVRFAEISLKFSQNQARPDLKLTTGMTWSQSDAKYGFSNVGASVAAIMRPDQRNGFVALNYRVPWGNRPAEERLEQQEERLKQTQKRLSLLANQVQRNVQDALASLNSAIEQSEIAEQNKEISDRLYKTVLDLWDKGRVPETAAGKSNPTFEIINRNNEMLSSGFRFIDAQIAVKQAEARLLAAEGAIASRYTENFKISIKPIEDPKADEKDKDSKEPEKEKSRTDKETVKEGAK
ncbi:MAG TPA: TolC family protein [Planctomycetota bacterium]|nr:TolC family protein [Planctomycetota bacterium]